MKESTGFKELLNKMMSRRWYITAMVLGGFMLIMFPANKKVQIKEKLKEFKTAGKVALRKFLDDINATDTKLNGRINEETVLLKVQ